jgi:RND family efflux transporter MFP subunit
MVRGLALILLSVCLAVVGCRKSAPPAEEIRPVKTAIADPGPLHDDFRTVGEIKPRYESDIGFRVDGKVILRAVDVGQTVKKGDLLARLDDQDYRSKLRSAEADVSAAQAELADAKGEEARKRQLMKEGWTTQAMYDKAQRNMLAAQAKLDAANASRDLARDQLNYTDLRADFDGVITATGAEAGQVVTAGQMIVRLAKPEDRDAVFNIAESILTKPQVGEIPPVIIALVTNPSVSCEGEVREISPVADPTTRTYQVKVTLISPPSEMRFGASVTGSLKTPGAAAVVLPAAALFEQGAKPAVWVVDPATKTVSLRPVTVSRYETDRVIIGGGLTKGDIVVIAGVNRLREGQKVQVQPREDHKAQVSEDGAS